jgi:hypothetical protein
MNKSPTQRPRRKCRTLIQLLSVVLFCVHEEKTVKKLMQTEQDEEEKMEALVVACDLFLLHFRLPFCMGDSCKSMP